MKKYLLNVEPFASRVKKQTIKTVETPRGLKFTDYIDIYNIAKASGLKSKSMRKVKKRAKIVIIQAITNYSEKLNVK